MEYMNINKRFRIFLYDYRNHVSFQHLFLYVSVNQGNFDPSTLVHITYTFTLLNKPTDYNLSFMTLVHMCKRAKHETDREITDKTFMTLNKQKKQRREKHKKAQSRIIK